MIKRTVQRIHIADKDFLDRRQMQLEFLMTPRTHFPVLSRVLMATALVSTLALAGCSKPAEEQPTSNNPVTVTATATPRGAASPRAADASATGGEATTGNAEAAPQGNPVSETVVPTTAKRDPEKATDLMGQADALQARGSYSEASTMYQDAMQADPDNVELPYKSACNYARWGKSEEAIESLGVAADMGYADAAAVKSSDAFGKLQENPRFQKIVSHIEKN